MKQIIQKMDQRILVFFGILLLVGLFPDVAIAQSGGIAGGAAALGGAAEQISGWVPAVKKLIYAIAGVVVFVGIISVFVKMNNEEQDVKKSIMLIVGAALFLVIAAEALPKFFS